MKRLKIEWSKKSKHLGSPGSLQIPSMIDGKICRQIRASKPGALQAHLRGSARWGAGSLPDLVRGQVRTRQRWDAQWLPGWYFMIFYDICQVWRTRPFSVCHIIACVDSCHWFNVLVHIILWYTVICIRYNLHRISIDIPYIYACCYTVYSTHIISYHMPLHYSFYIFTVHTSKASWHLFYGTRDFFGTCTDDLTSFSNGGISSDDCEAAVFRLSTCILCMGRPRGSTNARVEWNPDLLPEVFALYPRYLSWVAMSAAWFWGKAFCHPIARMHV